MNWQQLLPLLGIGSILAAIIGILGGIIGGYFTSRFQHQKQLKEYEHNLKKKRYLALNIMLLTKLDIPNRLFDLTNHRPQIQTEEDLDKEIQMEILNAYLFASNDVIANLETFINNPDYGNYYKVANAMRKDLWGKAKDLKMDIFHTD